MYLSQTNKINNQYNLIYTILSKLELKLYINYNKKK